MKKIILSNQIKCLNCGDEINSSHKNDYKKCKCGSVGVGGGTEYLKRVGSKYMDQSIITLDLCDKTVKNNIARICNTFKSLIDRKEL